MAVGAAWSAIRHRESAGRRRQYRHRGSRARARRTATRSSWSALANAINATLYDKLNFNFIRDIAPVAGIIRVPNVMVVNPSVPAKTVPEFIAYAKANPGKVNMASAGNGTAPHVAGELFKMMTGVNMVHVPYRGGAPALTDLLGGQVQVMFASHGRVDRVHQGRQAARAGGDHRDALGGAAGHPDRGRFRAGLRGELLVRHRRAQEHARRDHRQAQQGDQRRPRRSRRSRRGLPTWAATALPGSPADFGKLIAEETEKWGKVIRAQFITIEGAFNRGMDLEHVGKMISKDKKVALGVISHRTLQVEPEDVADLIRKGLKYIEPERLILTSDCQFGRQSMSRMHAFYKMVALTRGTNIVRKELGIEEAYIPATDKQLSMVPLSA